MAENKDNIIQEQNEDVLYKGQSIRGQDLPGPGDVEFVKQYQRADGKTFITRQKITVPAELFEEDVLYVEFEPVQNFEPGLAKPVGFKVKKGEIYPGDQVIIHFSSEGASDRSKFKVYTIIKDSTQKTFSFRPGNDVNSEHCFFALQISDSTGMKQLATVMSNEFAVQKPVPVVFTINEIKREVSPGEAINISFVWSNPKKVKKFKLMITSVTPRFSFNLPEIAQDTRSFTWTVPDTMVETSAAVLSIIAVGEDDQNFKLAHSKPFKIKMKKEFLLSLMKAEVEHGETIILPFTFRNLQTPDHFMMSLMSASGENIPLLPHIEGSKRELRFTIPLTVEGSNFSVGVFASDKDGKIFAQAQTRIFSIKKGAHSLPEVDLYKPIPGKDLQAGTRVELGWKINHPSNKDFKTDLIIAYEYQGKEFPIAQKSNTDRGVTIWNINANAPDPLEVMIVLTMPEVSVRKEFGPFKIVGGNSGPDTEGDHELVDKIKIIDGFLGTIKLPAKRSFFGAINSRSIGTFLFHIVGSNEIDNYFTAYNKLIEVQQELAKEEFKTVLESHKEYKEYFDYMTRLAEIRTHLEGLQDKKSLKGRLKDLLNMFLKVKNMKKSLIEDFKGVFGVEPNRFNADLLLRDVKYLSWFIEHASEVDNVIAQEIGPSMFKMVDLYKWLETVLAQAEQMYDLLQASRKILRQLKTYIKS